MRKWITEYIILQILLTRRILQATLSKEWRYWDNGLTDISSAHHTTTIAYKQRDKLADYFLTSPGNSLAVWIYSKRARRGIIVASRWFVIKFYLKLMPLTLSFNTI